MDSSNSLVIKGVSKDKTKLLGVSVYSVSNEEYLDIENVSLEVDYSFSWDGEYGNITFKNVNFHIVSEDFGTSSAFLLNFDGTTTMENVYFNNECILLNDYYNSSAVYINSTNVNIDNLIIDNSVDNVDAGLFLDNVKEATINNLTVNNAKIGLYVHRPERNKVDSNIEVNNSNLLNTTCSIFNVLDKRGLQHVRLNNKNNNLTINSLINNMDKNYQVVFNSENKLNCAVASGTDTNTLVSGDNTWNKEPTSYTYDEINYDNLTNTTQNVNKGTVDVGKKYKGTVTIEEGSSTDIDNAFESNTELSSNITWTSKDESIAKIENGKILGLKEGTTTITGLSSDSLITYEIEVNVINNPVTNSSIYIGVGLVLILILGTALYTVYRIKVIVNKN